VDRPLLGPSGRPLQPTTSADRSGAHRLQLGPLGRRGIAAARWMRQPRILVRVGRAPRGNRCAGGANLTGRPM
jgi:hypothetical protein